MSCWVADEPASFGLLPRHSLSAADQRVLPSRMPAALLLAATVDPRLAEPLRLLAEVGARESIDRHPGPSFAELPESIDLTLAVGDPPRGAVGYFDHGLGAVVIAESIIDEDPRAVAVIFAHELQHALDMHRHALGLLEPECLALEVRGSTADAPTARLFWFERRIAAVARAYERDGTAGLVVCIIGDDRYREACAEWLP